jgi:hypothetical protein
MVWKKTAGLLSRGVVAAALLVGAASSSWNVPLEAQSGTIVLTPTVGITPPLTFITVNDGPGHQFDPHVSGDLVSYTDQLASAFVRYFRFSTGTDDATSLEHGRRTWR